MNNTLDYIQTARYCTLLHVHNISWVSTSFVPWTPEHTRLIEDIVNHGDRDRLALGMPSLCSMRTDDGRQVESWMSFLASRIEWLSTDDAQLQYPRSPYVSRMQLPWTKEVVPAIVLNMEEIHLYAKEAGVSVEIMFAFISLWGLGLACMDTSNLLIPCDGGFTYQKGKTGKDEGFSRGFRRIAATELAKEYLNAYFCDRKKEELNLLNSYLSNGKNSFRRSFADFEMMSFLRKGTSLPVMTICSKESEPVLQQMDRDLSKQALSGFLGIDLTHAKNGVLNIQLDKRPQVKLKLTRASVVWYILLMLHPEGVTRKELFTPKVMREYLTIEHYLHGEGTPSDREVERFTSGEKTLRDKLNKSLQRLRDTQKKAFAKQKGYDYSMFIPTAATSLNPKSATKIALKALQSPNQIQCYIPKEIQNILSDATPKNEVK